MSQKARCCKKVFEGLAASPSLLLDVCWAAIPLKQLGDLHGRTGYWTDVSEVLMLQRGS